jgi:hypothetical protein
MEQGPGAKLRKPSPCGEKRHLAPPKPSPCRADPPRPDENRHLARSTCRLAGEKRYLAWNARHLARQSVALRQRRVRAGGQESLRWPKA